MFGAEAFLKSHRSGVDAGDGAGCGRNLPSQRTETSVSNFTLMQRYMLDEIEREIVSRAAVGNRLS
jgi:hypothetical protein